MSLIMSELSTFCVVYADCFYFYHQQLHQTSHKAICFSDIRLENVLKNLHRGSRVRRQDKARWSKMVGSTSLNGISWFLVPKIWTCSHNMFMCAWGQHSCDVWRYRCFEAYEWYDPWNLSILWLSFSQPANKFHMQISYGWKWYNHNLSRETPRACFPNHTKICKPLLPLGILSTARFQYLMIATAQVHMPFCVIHFRSPSSSQIAKSPRNRSQLRLYIKQHFQKKIKKYIYLTQKLQLFVCLQSPKKLIKVIPILQRSSKWFSKISRSSTGPKANSKSHTRFAPPRCLRVSRSPGRQPEAGWDSGISFVRVKQG